MKYFKKIQGERIYLSPINLDDASLEMYTKWINDPAITDNLGNSSQVYTMEREKSLLEDMMKDGYHFSIVLTEKDELIGNVSIVDINQIHRNAQCGLFIGEEENRSKGYGSDALKLLLQFCFETLNLNNVMLKVFDFNKRAVACYEKVGFKRIGERRSTYFVRGEYHNEIFMDILAEDFKEIQKRRG